MHLYLAAGAGCPFWCRGYLVACCIGIVKQRVAQVPEELADDCWRKVRVPRDLTVDPFLCAHVVLLHGVVELVDLRDRVGVVAVRELLAGDWVHGAEVAQDGAGEEPEANDLRRDLEGERDGVDVAGDEAG